MDIGGVSFSLDYVAINGTELAVLSAGEGQPILALHGFPDTPHTFEHQYQPLIEAGYRVIAPFLRGYPPSYSSKTLDVYAMRLVEDVLELSEKLCAGRAILLAHDWGAIAAYAAVNLAPNQFRGLMTMAVPHWSCFDKLATNPRQWWRSRYAFFFQFRRLSEFMMRRNDMSGIDYLWSYWSPTWHYTDADIRPVKDCFQSVYGLHCATQYYRDMVRKVGRDKDFQELMSRQVSLPTHVVAGANDGCIGIEVFDGIEAGFSAGVSFDVIQGAGHFMHRERPDTFNPLMMAFLSQFD